MSTVAAPNYYTRFTPGQRAMHGVLMVSFLGLAGTGLPLRFSGSAWSVSLTKAAGGFTSILFLHKFFAVMLTIDFLIHLADLAYRIVVKKERGLLWGPNSMVPNLKDVRDFFEQMKWLLFLGPKPRFDRYTYWEKVDYWAVFWGMGIIGLSGYAMWFSGLFARIVPGSWLNVALLIHGEEALLAVGYIFVVHFFNEHLRPDNFPMDVTIFLGAQSEEEFRQRHPEEYERAVQHGSLNQIQTQAPPVWAVRTARVVGGSAILVGLVLIVLTVRAFTAR